jgi:hypothetical protein
MRDSGFSSGRNLCYLAGRRVMVTGLRVARFAALTSTVVLGCTASVGSRIIAIPSQYGEGWNYWQRLDYSHKDKSVYIDPCPPGRSGLQTTLANFHSSWTGSDGQEVRSVMELWRVDCERGVGESAVLAYCPEAMGQGSCMLHIDELAFTDPGNVRAAPEVPAICAYLASPREIPSECTEK